jgi:hypothetical protein
MRYALKIFMMLVTGIVLGLAVTWATVIKSSIGGDMVDGPWRTSINTGSSEGGPYLRARIAVHGLLALSREETVYCTAQSDSDGSALDGNCAYRLEGRDPPARWWSVTAYGADDFPIPNDVDRYSVSANSVERGADGRFTVILSRARAEHNWIPTAQGRFDLTVRLYNPQTEVIADPAHAELPSIKRLDCE